MACKQKIIKCFNSGAYSYDQAADVQPKAAQYLAQMLTHIRAQNILEIGCGTGQFSQYLIQHFPQAKMLLTDIAPQMVELSRQRLAPHQVIQMDGEALSLAEKFDLIASSMTLHWFSEIKESFQQIVSHLKPKGKFIFSMLGENSLKEWREICESNKVSIATPEFSNVHKLQESLPDLKIEIVNVKQHYPNAQKFLQTLKSIGAHASRPGHVPLRAAVLRQLMRVFDKKYSAGADITYEIIYGSYEKP